MPRRKRKYEPKTKGCYECSQRRIHCDRAEPQCKKCAVKGISCSGMGIRHRFHSGMAARGRFTGKSIDAVYEQTRHKPRPVKQNINNVLGESDMILSDSSSALPFATESAIGISSNRATSNDFQISTTPSSDVPSWKRQMLLHFSEHIACEMVAFDGPHNGWRSIVLPMALEDELVMNAVLAVASFHSQLYYQTEIFSRDLPLRDYDGHGLSSAQLYGAVVRGLRQRQNLQSYDQRVQLSILLTILLLLVVAMVTGSPDFPIMFKASQSALRVIEGSCMGENDLAEFISRQFQKLRVYAAPFMSESDGLQVLSSQNWSMEVLCCLNYCQSRQPQHASAVCVITDLVHQAHDIYINQARTLNSTDLFPSSIDTTKSAFVIPDTVTRIERFKQTLQLFPEGSPGEQVLIWASFIAASDCVLEEHKTFFRELFQRYHQRSGFKNILGALSLLQKIWNRPAEDRWTSLLPLERLFVM